MYIGIGMNQEYPYRPRFEWLVACILWVGSSTCLQAQIPAYFEQGQIWRFDQSSAYDGCALYEEHAYYVSGDTVIGQIEYRRLLDRGRRWEEFIGGGQGQGVCNSEFGYFDQLVGHIRQSSDSVFILDPFVGASERLLISYNMQVGDTLRYFDQWNEVVQYIDTVVINGSAHRRFHFNDQQHYLIEGVVDVDLQGQSSPLFAELVGMNIGPLDVICFSENDSTVWTGPSAEFSTCDYFIGLAMNEIHRVPFEASLFPNPASTHLNIAVANSISYSFALCNVMGEQVLYALNLKFIDLSGLAAGTYVAEVKDLRSGRSVRERIIVAH